MLEIAAKRPPCKLRLNRYPKKEIINVPNIAFSICLKFKVFIRPYAYRIGRYINISSLTNLIEKCLTVIILNSDISKNKVGTISKCLTSIFINLSSEF